MSTRRSQSSGRGRPGPAGPAFTLIEVLVVLALLAIVASIGVPAIVQSAQKTALRQAVDSVVEGCRRARMKAILEGVTTELVVQADSGTLSVRTVGTAPRPEAGGEELAQTVADGRPDEAAPVEPPSSSPTIGFSARIPESVAFKKLVVNLQDMMDYEEASVRFYPNGTCDAFSAVLLSEQNEERSITLEITTGRETVDVIR